MDSTGDREDASEETTNLYAILNIPRNASLEEIRNAYRRLCIMYHPDKHLEEGPKLAAERVFNKVQTAYNVLSNAELRQVYDRLGMEGVEAAWQVGPYFNGDLKKLIEEMERMRKERQYGTWKAKTVLSSSIDATMWTEDWTPIRDQMTFMDYLPEMNAISMTQRFEGTFSDTTSTSITYSAAAKNGSGSLMLTGNMARYFSARTRGRIDLGLGDRKFISIGASQALSKHMSVDLACVANVHGGSILPSFQAGLSHMLGQQHALTTTILGGAHHGVTLSLQRLTETNPSTISIQLVEQSIGVELKWAYQLDKASMVKFKLNHGINNATQLSLGLSNKLDLAKWSIYIEGNTSLGIAIKFVYVVRDYHFVFPIYLSRDLSTTSFLLATALPSLFGLVLHNLVLEPYRRYSTKRYWEDFNREKQAMLEYKRQEAQMITDLLLPLYERRKEAELANNGLVILSAVYERIPDDNLLFGSSSKSWDVTVPLQMLVIDSYLYLPTGSKADLLGFYNVAMGQQKRLRVRYIFRGREHSTLVQDEDELVAPLRDHLVA